jgi:hypothetical protein
MEGGYDMTASATQAGTQKDSQQYDHARTLSLSLNPVNPKSGSSMRVRVRSLFK